MAVAAFPAFRTKAFIDGQFQDAASGETFVTENPATGQPIATPVNLIAMGAAGYRFGDYWKLGSVVMVVFFVVGVFLVPVFFPL